MRTDSERICHVETLQLSNGSKRAYCAYSPAPSAQAAAASPERDPEAPAPLPVSLMRVRHASVGYLFSISPCWLGALMQTVCQAIAEVQCLLRQAPSARTAWRICCKSAGVSQILTYRQGAHWEGVGRRLATRHDTRNRSRFAGSDFTPFLAHLLSFIGTRDSPCRVSIQRAVIVSLSKHRCWEPHPR